MSNHAVKPYPTKHPYKMNHAKLAVANSQGITVLATTHSQTKMLDPNDAGPVLNECEPLFAMAGKSILKEKGRRGRGF